MAKNFFGPNKGFLWEQKAADGTTFYDENESHQGQNIYDEATGRPYNNVSNLENPLYDQSTELDLEKEAEIKTLLEKYQNFEELSEAELKKIKHLI